MTPEEFAAHNDRFAWRRNDVHDTLLTEINYRIGRHRSRPVSSSDVASAARSGSFVGFYRPNDRTMHLVVPENIYVRDLEAEMRTLAHEYVHAYQDATYDLTASRNKHAVDSDSGLAWTTVIEGHAGLVDSIVGAQWDGLDIYWLDWGLWAADGLQRMVEEIDDSVEPYFWARHQIRYDIGRFLATRRFVNGGHRVSAIDVLFTEPPRSTADLLYRSGFHFIEASPLGLEEEPLPLLAGVELLNEAGLITYDLYGMGAWDVALLLAPDLGADSALSAVDGLRRGALQVLLTEDWEPVFVFTVDMATARRAQQLAADFREVFGEARWKVDEPPQRQDQVRVHALDATVLMVQSADSAILDLLFEALRDG